MCRPILAAGLRAIGRSGLRACGESDGDPRPRNVGAVSGVGERTDADTDADIEADTDADADAGVDPSPLCKAARVASIERPTTALEPWWEGEADGVRGARPMPPGRCVGEARGDDGNDDAVVGTPGTSVHSSSGGSDVNEPLRDGGADGGRELPDPLKRRCPLVVPCTADAPTLGPRSPTLPPPAPAPPLPPPPPAADPEPLDAPDPRRLTSMSGVGSARSVFIFESDPRRRLRSCSSVVR